MEELNTALQSIVDKKERLKEKKREIDKLHFETSKLEEEIREESLKQLEKKFKQEFKVGSTYVLDDKFFEKKYYKFLAIEGLTIQCISFSYNRTLNNLDYSNHSEFDLERFLRNINYITSISQEEYTQALLDITKQVEEYRLKELEKRRTN